MFFDVSNVGNRETVDDSRASELLKPLLESTDMVSSICLSNKVLAALARISKIKIIC
jgi:hypothetical protein